MTEIEQAPSLDTVRQRLRDLPNTENTRQSRQGKIRALLPEIESAIEQGVSRATIVEQLNEAGIAITLPIFATALHRARAARGKKKGGRQAPALESGQAPAPRDADEPRRARNPGDLKKARTVDIDMKSLTRNAKPTSTEKG